MSGIRWSRKQALTLSEPLKVYHERTKAALELHEEPFSVIGDAMRGAPQNREA
jgi:hypothetical protein